MLLEMRCAMSISKYQVFLKTVSCGSFSKAAEAMNFTQSGISHAINSLENELGVKLLSRNRGGVVLTADGRAVLPKIEKLCAAMFQTMQDALAEQKQEPLSMDDVTAMIAGQIGQLLSMDEETSKQFQALAKKMMVQMSKSIDKKKGD